MSPDKENTKEDSPKAASSPLLTTKEAAEYLRLSTQTLTQWRSEKKHVDELPTVKISNRVMYRRVDLDKFIKRRLGN